MADFDEELDATGLNCPLPILRAKKALNGICLLYTSDAADDRPRV